MDSRFSAKTSAATESAAVAAVAAAAVTAEAADESQEYIGCKKGRGGVQLNRLVEERLQLNANGGRRMRRRGRRRRRRGGCISRVTKHIRGECEIFDSQKPNSAVFQLEVGVLEA